MIIESNEEEEDNGEFEVFRNEECAIKCIELLKGLRMYLECFMVLNFDIIEIQIIQFINECTDDKEGSELGRNYDIDNVDDLGDNRIFNFLLIS